MAHTTDLHVLLIDDHPLFSIGFAHALQTAGAGIQVRTAESIDAGLATAADWPLLDIVLLDYRLPGQDGLVGVRRFGEVLPLVARLLISGLDDDQLAARARQAGACGVLSKSLSLPGLLEALQTVAAGGEWFQPTGRVDGGLDEAADGPTVRQMEVLNLVAQGLPNKLIASQLGIAERTVKLHVTALLETLRAQNRTHLLVVARDRGLLA
ncbi:MAG TPA: response regulator transcription factor [Ideonella sp.]|uniref:response regulator transcription factor n=1 Tax=Ideonella sp. TaxID=1929293 RepID=UPI002E37AFF5|nr:response regulator transcription factor [Ideonella sp.]HEX5687813.1 response regulator transcription factor [Ideonella sp.]